MVSRQSGGSCTPGESALADTLFRVMLKPFTADDLYHAVRDVITRAADLTVIAEHEIVVAHARLE